jgi:hypothetical protein
MHACAQSLRAGCVLRRCFCVFLFVVVLATLTAALLFSRTRTTLRPTNPKLRPLFPDTAGAAYSRPPVPLIADISEFGLRHCAAEYLEVSTESLLQEEVCHAPFSTWASLLCRPAGQCEHAAGGPPCAALSPRCADLLRRPPSHGLRRIECPRPPSHLSPSAPLQCDVTEAISPAKTADGIVIAHVGFFPDHLLPNGVNAELLEAYLNPPERVLRRQLWAIKAMWEPSVIYTAARDAAVLRHMNYGFGSDRLALPGFRMSYMPDWDRIVSPWFGEDRFGPDIGSITISNKSSVLFLTSNCRTSWGRESYVAELMRYMNVDSWGRCLNNRDGAAFTRAEDGSNFAATLDSKHIILSAYKFVLAFENSIQTDYVTEKLFDAFETGAVPVYFGAPNVVDYIPGEGSYIDASRHSPRQLARLLDFLDANKTAYMEFHAWRTRPVQWIRTESPLAKTIAIHAQSDPFCTLCTMIHAEEANVSVRVRVPELVEREREQGLPVQNLKGESRGN